VTCHGFVTEEKGEADAPLLTGRARKEAASYRFALGVLLARALPVTQRQAR